MPAPTDIHSDSVLSILTLWRRLIRNAHSRSLNISILWSTCSKALAKSTKTVWTNWPVLTAWCQWCKTSTKGCVVERSLSLHSVRSRINNPTKDSDSFPSVAVSEIGRKSDSIDLGGWTLGTGTLASFHRPGMKLSRTDALKIEHIGPASQAQKSRRTQLGKPSGPCALQILMRLSLISTDVWSESGGGGAASAAEDQRQDSGRTCWCQWPGPACCPGWRDQLVGWWTLNSCQWVT